MKVSHTPPLDPSIHLRIAEEYQAGATVPDLVSRYRTTSHHVRVALKAQGVRLRSRGESNRQKGLKTRAPIDEVLLRRLVDEKKSISEIAGALGVTRPTAEKRMARLGLKSKHGKGSPGEKNYFWKGGRFVDDDGYVLIHHPDHPYATQQGYVREHRLVMEKVLGRYLLPTEVVHHKNRNDRASNNPKDLQVFSSNAEHLAHELTGKPKNLTPEGRQRLRENAQRVNQKRRSATRLASKSDDAR